MSVNSSNMEVATTGDSAVVPENVQENSEGGGVQQQQPQPSQGSSYWSILKSIMIRALIVYLVSSIFRRQPTTNQSTNGEGAPVAESRMPSSNLFVNGTIMDIYMFSSEEELHVDFKNPNSLVWKIPSVIYGDWNGGPQKNSIYTLESSIAASETVQRNGSIWLHVFIVKGGMSPDPEDQRRYLRMFTVHKYRRLNRYKKRRYLQTHNLLTGKTTASAETIEKSISTPIEILSHWHPNLTINIVDDHTHWVQGHVPPPLDEYVEFEPTSGKYYPIVYMNDYWNLMRDYTPVNETTKQLPLFLTFQPLTLFKWQMYTAQAMRSRWMSMLGQDLMEESEEDQDSLKETLLETSPYLLGITFAVSILHSVFEFLAFKNDIQFWKNRKSLEGLSVRSVFFNVFQSLVVLLYVLDNDTNMMVRISVFVGLGIEIWKIQKVTSININREERFLGFFPRITFQDKGSYVESSTKQYDLLAFRYLSWALFPLLGCYAVYSLMYVEHKGWYSWLLSMLYGFLLTFGFIMMTPQLFINYKLKSVAHLPWRMLTYKFLNTFIDDIFAFVIKMPTMYRLGCFRDDIIFLIFLYQRWIYRVDPKRVNEFGTSGEMDSNSSSSVPGEITANGEISETANGTLVHDKKND